MDLALQCAPDHPWARDHRQWFTELPDGTIAYAENPPKKYQDIYPLNFDNDPAGLYDEVLRVVRHWIDHGIKFFRVDNPHTKPPDFWAWLIGQVKDIDPDVLFLSEAFTPPARQYGLAKLGFTQSYSYFTWRTAKWELTEFGNDIAALADFRRPNLFVNTPDILHAILQHNGPGMFAIRAALAATLSPAWGVYSGYELSSTARYAKAARNISTRRSTNYGPAIMRRHSPKEDRSNRCSNSSTQFAGCIPLCSNYAPSIFTASTTMRYWPSASSIRPPGTVCWWW